MELCEQINGRQKIRNFDVFTTEFQQMNDLILYGCGYNFSMMRDSDPLFFINPLEPKHFFFEFCSEIWWRGAFGGETDRV